MSELTREDIIAAARRAAQESGANVLSRDDFERLTKIGQYHIYRLFPDGGWSEVIRLAGLEINPLYNLPVSDEALLAEFHSVATALGRIPTWAQFGSRAAFSADTVRKRFGGLRGTCERYRQWLGQNDPASPILDLLPAASRYDSTSSAPLSLDREIIPAKQWPKHEGVQYGAPIDFRGLRHAPINEQGVVYLFGMVSRELGFIVEAIHSAFPDCVAKRSVDHRGVRWQQVRIEFEFRSSNFDHDPNGCDLIVCWDHDWLDCPLEVIELSRVIRELE